MLSALTFTVADLAGDRVADQSAGHITLDINAAGHGWFVDPTPLDNSEFTHAQNAAGTDLLTDPSNAAAGHLDLLTACRTRWAINSDWMTARRRPTRTT